LTTLYEQNEPRARKNPVFIAMLVYLLAVYVWALWLHPLGRDYSAFANAGYYPFLVDRLLAWEMAVFGAGPVGYHVVNLAVLYGCMLCVYRLTRLAVQGPFWLGTLAATLFMANPVHSEAVLNLSGITDLIPALLALMALLAYAEDVAAPRTWRHLFALALFALAAVPYSVNAGLIVVLFLYELLVAPRRNWRRFLWFVPIAAAGWIHYGELFVLSFPYSILPGSMWGPLYFIFYPIGFLPENASRFVQHPWLGWLSAVAVIAILAAIYRKARRPAILFGLLAMPALRLFQGADFVNLVHLVGGGSLLVASAMFNIAFVALCHRMMDHPQWRRPVVMGTTLLALLLFVLEWRSIQSWHKAGDMVKSFQTDAANIVTDEKKPIGVLPDFRYYRGAPLELSRAIAYDTPFSKRHPALSLLPIHYDPALTVEATPTGADGAYTLILSGVAPATLVTYRIPIAAGELIPTQGASVKITAIAPDRLELLVTPKRPVAELLSISVFHVAQASCLHSEQARCLRHVFVIVSVTRYPDDRGCRRGRSGRPSAP